MTCKLRSGSINPDGERGRLYFTVGLPGSGKSTLLNNLVRETTKERPSVIISGDDLRIALHGSEYIPRAESMMFSVMDITILALLERGFDVYVDETSTSKPTLMRYLRLDSEASPIFVNTPKEDCLARRPHLAHVIERLDARRENVVQNWEKLKVELLAKIEHRAT